MFSYHARLDPTDDDEYFHVVCTHLMGLFYGTNVKVEIMDDDDWAWIIVYITGTKDECMQLDKRLRRLARGKPRFTISQQTFSELTKTPADRLREQIDRDHAYNTEVVRDDFLPNDNL